MEPYDGLNDTAAVLGNINIIKPKNEKTKENDFNNNDHGDLNHISVNTIRRLSYLKELETITNNASIINEIENDRMRSNANRRLQQRLENRLLNRFGQRASLLLTSSESETDISINHEGSDEGKPFSEQVPANNKNIYTNLELDGHISTNINNFVFVKFRLRQTKMKK